MIERIFRALCEPRMFYPDPRWRRRWWARYSVHIVTGLWVALIVAAFVMPWHR